MRVLAPLALVLLSVLPAAGEHEIWYRYTVLGYALDAGGRPRAGERVELVRERNRARLRTVCTNQRGEEVLAGEAWVMPSRQSVVYEGRRAGPVALAALAMRSWLAAAEAGAAWGLLGLHLLGQAGRRRA